MEAAEKIPKKLYVYLDTTRGAGHGRGRQDVCDRRAGAGLRHQRLRALRRDSPALFPGIKSGKRGAAQAAPLFPSGLQKIEAIQTKTLDKRDGW